MHKQCRSWCALFGSPWGGLRRGILGLGLLLAGLGSSLALRGADAVVITAPAAGAYVPTGAAVRFSATSPSSSVAGFGWNFGDGTSTIPSVDGSNGSVYIPPSPISHTYTTPGVYTITCTAYRMVVTPPPPPTGPVPPWVPPPVVRPVPTPVASATLTINVSPLNLPVLISSPASATLLQGASARFAVTATGATAYQWQRNLVDIPGATAASYTIPAVSPADHGASFRALIFNGAGRVISDAARLTVLMPPAITSQPADIRGLHCEAATFRVGVSGTEPFTYQWHRNGVAIPGAQGATCTVPLPGAADSNARFSVVVKNAWGSVTSASAVLSVEVPTRVTPVDFKLMSWTQNGLIMHFVSGRVDETHLGPPAPWGGSTPQPQGSTQLYTLLTEESYWTSPVGIFPSRALTPEQAVDAIAAGLARLPNSRSWTEAQRREEAQKRVDAMGTMYHGPNGTRSITITESSQMSWGGTAGSTECTQNLYGDRVDVQDRRQGTLNLVVDLPQTPTNYWRLGVTNALGEERYSMLTLSPGPQTLQVSNVEAGNCLVSLAAINGNLTSGSLALYHREVPVIVRTDAPGTAAMRFVTSATDPSRYRLHSLTVGQNSQNEAGSVYLTQGRDAMVRVMAMDAKGEGSPIAVNENNYFGSVPVWNHTILLEAFDASGAKLWSDSFTDTLSSYPVNSGAACSDPRFLVKGAYVKEGLRVQATLLDMAGNVLDRRSVTPLVNRPRKIVVHGYDVRPFRGASGCPGARNGAEMANILAYTQDAFPYSTFEYRYEGKVWMMDPTLGINSANLGTMRIAATMATMNYIQGWHSVDRNAEEVHLYLGMMNDRYRDGGVTGIAFYGMRGLALFRVPNAEHLAYSIAHEMGHNFGLYHPPSRGVGQKVLGLFQDRVNTEYPYGGGGLAAGWGYASLSRYFLGEDSHTFRKGKSAHWDIMSYTPAPIWSDSRFSDVHTERLRPDFGRPRMISTGQSLVSLATHSSGIPVLDAKCAARVQALTAATKAAMVAGDSASVVVASPMPEDTAPRAYKVDAGQVDPLQGIDPSLGDPDDEVPEPPVLIVTKAPTIE